MKDLSLGDEVRLKYNLKYGNKIVYPYGSKGIVIRKVEIAVPTWAGYEGPAITMARDVIVKMLEEVKPFPQEIELNVSLITK